MATVHGYASITTGGGAVVKRRLGGVTHRRVQAVAGRVSVVVMVVMTVVGMVAVAAVVAVVVVVNVGWSERWQQQASCQKPT